MKRKEWMLQDSSNWWLWRKMSSLSKLTLSMWTHIWVFCCIHTVLDQRYINIEINVGYHRYLVGDIALTSSEVGGSLLSEPLSEGVMQLTRVYILYCILKNHVYSLYSLHSHCKLYTRLCIAFSIPTVQCYKVYTTLSFTNASLA